MKKKSILLFYLIFVLAPTLLSQSYITLNSEYTNLDKFRTINVHLSNPLLHHHLKNIHSVIVIDARSDTSSIGFMQKHQLNNIFVKLHKGSRFEIERFVESYLSLSSSSSDTLIMILKKLWLSDEIAKIDHKLNEPIFSNPDSSSGIIAKIEFYIKKQDDYYPLYRYDSIIIKPSLIAEYANEYLQLAITNSLNKLIKMDSVDALFSNHKLAFSEIEAYNKKPFDIAILKDYELKKGAYKTFEEFKNNNPSDKNFEIVRTEKTDILYLKDSTGKEFVTRDAWGYCDGKLIFIKLVNGYYRLQRKENTFYFYGTKITYLSNSSNPVFLGTPPGSPITIAGVGADVYNRTEEIRNVSKGAKYTKNGVYPKPYQLDCDTGDFY